MIKRTEEGFKEIAKKINDAYEYNKDNPNSTIKTLALEISRGLYNLGDEELFKRVKEQTDYKFELHTNDHDDYVMLFIDLK